ncbi:hypothetical protein D1872_90430 [compost metagenome]
MRNKLLDNSSQLPSARVILIVTNALLFAYRMIITYFDEHCSAAVLVPNFHKNQARTVYGGRKIQWLP